MITQYYFVSNCMNFKGEDMNKLFLLILTILLVMAFMVSGCSKPTPTSTTPVETTPAITTVTPKYGGTLIIQYGAEMNQPGDPRDDSAMALAFRYCAVENLARINASDELYPYLADSWSGDAAAKTVTVKLKEGIQFQDGTPFNADAVKFTWGLYQEAKRAEIANIDSVEVLDDYTLQVNLTQWDNSIFIKILNTCGTIISPTAWEKNGDEAKNIPVGTGPFKFVTWTPNVGGKFVKWDGYWQKDKGYPYVDAIEYKNIADLTTASAALMAGEVDMIENVVDPLIAKNLSTTPGIVVTVDKSGIESATFALHPDLGVEGVTTIFDDINIRKAVAYAIDTESIVKNFTYGFSETTNQWCMKNNWAYSPNVKGYPYNPAKARELLEAAGYPDGFETSIMCFSDMQNFAEAIQGMLGDVGITATIRGLAPPAMYEYIIKGGWEGLRLTPERCNGNVPYRMSVYLTTGAFEGIGLYHSAELDQMFKDALAATDFETQQERAWKINEFVYDTQCAVIPLYVNYGINAKLPYVKDDHFATTGASFWTPEQVWLDK